MNIYNEKWTRKKFLEYKKLKREGFTDKMLIEHFGDDIYYSNMYSKKSSIMPWLEFITEILITPEYTSYDISDKPSDVYANKIDYIIKFTDNNHDYIICLFFYIIDNINTYNILLTTKDQWIGYIDKMNQIKYKGYITDQERLELVDIVEKETGYNQLYPVIKKVSYILLDFAKNYMNEFVVSIGETKNLVKINLYRNIIKNSFPDISEVGCKVDESGNKYYIYNI